MVTVYHAYLGEKRRKKICTKEKGISKILKLLFHFFFNIDIHGFKVILLITVKKRFSFKREAIGLQN